MFDDEIRKKIDAFNKAIRLNDQKIKLFSEATNQMTDFNKAIKAVGESQKKIIRDLNIDWSSVISEIKKIESRQTINSISTRINVESPNNVTEGLNMVIKNIQRAINNLGNINNVDQVKTDLNSEIKRLRSIINNLPK